MLLAAVAFGIAAAFLTVAGLIALSEIYGPAMASALIGGLYAAVAILLLALRPRELVTEPDRISMGLALGASFAQGFAAGRQVRR